MLIYKIHRKNIANTPDTLANTESALASGFWGFFFKVRFFFLIADVFWKKNPCFVCSAFDLVIKSRTVKIKLTVV